MKRILIGLAATLAFAGCTTTRPPGAALNEYLPFTGPPVESFHFWNLYSWEAVGPYQVVLWATPWEAYFVTVASPCIDLEWTHRLGVSSTANTVSHFEYVLVGHQERCPILEIRPIDVKKLNAARKERAAAQKAGVAVPPSPPPPAPPPQVPPAAAT